MPARHPIDLQRRFELEEDAATRLGALVDAVLAEPDPPTTIRTYQAVLERHLADSLEGLGVRALREASRIADVGAGAGFPGLPLAIALPDTSFELVEATKRKCAVIERLAAAAGATNARAIPLRAEEWAAGEGHERCDAVVARAVAALPVLVEYAAPLLTASGVLVAWKGRRDPHEERSGAAAAALAGLKLEDVRRVTPFEGAEHRHLYVYRKVNTTPGFLPRRPGAATKHPLG